MKTKRPRKATKPLRRTAPASAPGWPPAGTMKTLVFLALGGKIEFLGDGPWEDQVAHLTHPDAVYCLGNDSEIALLLDEQGWLTYHGPERQEYARISAAGLVAAKRYLREVMRMPLHKIVRLKVVQLKT